MRLESNSAQIGWISNRLSISRVNWNENLSQGSLNCSNWLCFWLRIWSVNWNSFNEWLHPKQKKKLWRKFVSIHLRPKLIGIVLVLKMKDQIVVIMWPNQICILHIIPCPKWIANQNNFQFLCQTILLLLYLWLSQRINSSQI